MVNTKEQLVLWSIQDSFEGEDMQIQYSVLGYRIDLYFHDYKKLLNQVIIIEILTKKYKDKKQ